MFLGTPSQQKDIKEFVLLEINRIGDKKISLFDLSIEIDWVDFFEDRDIKEWLGMSIYGALESLEYDIYHHGGLLGIAADFVGFSAFELMKKLCTEDAEHSISKLTSAIEGVDKW